MDLRTRLAGNESTGGKIPSVNAVLKIGIYAPLGHAAQIEGGCSNAADIADLRQQLGQQLRLLLAPLCAIAKSRRNQGKRGVILFTAP